MLKQYVIEVTTILAATVGALVAGQGGDAYGSESR